MKTKKGGLTLTQFIPYIGSILIFLGVLRLTYFYNSFGVSIINYLEFSEILSSFLGAIIFSIVLFLFLSIQNFLIKNKEESERLNSIAITLHEQNNFFMRIPLYFKMSKKFLFDGIITLIVFFGYNLFSGKKEYLTFGWAGVIYVIVFILFLYCQMKLILNIND